MRLLVEQSRAANKQVRGCADCMFVRRESSHTPLPSFHYRCVRAALSSWACFSWRTASRCRQRGWPRYSMHWAGTAVRPTVWPTLTAGLEPAQLACTGPQGEDAQAQPLIWRRTAGAQTCTTRVHTSACTTVPTPCEPPPVPSLYLRMAGTAAFQTRSASWSRGNGQLIH